MHTSPENERDYLEAIAWPISVNLNMNILLLDNLELKLRQRPDLLAKILQNMQLR